MAQPLREAVRLAASKIVNPESLNLYGGIREHEPVLVILAAGKGTRFGQAPKCIQPVCGLPLARHSIDAFRSYREAPVVCVVHHKEEEIIAALGDDNIYVHSDSATAGTAFAAYEAFSLGELQTLNPVLIITMGDRVVTSGVFKRLFETHTLGGREADLTLLSALYETPKNFGKGRILRGPDRRVLRIVEQKDIDLVEDPRKRQQLQEITEGNCPLYAVRASKLRPCLEPLQNENAQQQYYLTDIVEAISGGLGEIRTLTTSPADPEYDLLCSDVTRPMDLALLEGVLASLQSDPHVVGVEAAAKVILEGRPPGQVQSIAAQLEELLLAADQETLGFRENRPVGIGISGGRIRIAFMHPDMGRFFGPAWQMPLGARDADSREQIVVAVQSANDGKIHLFPTNPLFREKLNEVPADNEFMYPGEQIADWYAYEGFGTRMAENLLLSLGYFTDEEVHSRREKGLPLPPPSLWVGNSMRRPFSLIGNAIASMRTLRTGNLGARVQTYLGRDGFRGLRVLSTGSIPQGGFSSSSAVTVAVKNAINALFELGISSGTLVHLACQAEYGTGVRAGALDQATEQSGRFGQGTLISSNPRENYRIIGTYPVPAERFKVLFCFSVDRDRAAWEWSHGAYAPAPEPRRLTAAEMRKMTGKASELAAIFTRLPFEKDFFQFVEQDLVELGYLGSEALDWTRRLLRSLPLAITQAELRGVWEERRKWYIESLMEQQRLGAAVAGEKADSTFESLLAGWHDPTLFRTGSNGLVVEQLGLPMRATLAYLFCEMAKNFQLIHRPTEWIRWVTASQRGDRCFQIEVEALPTREQMMGEMTWEKLLSGPALMDEWLRRFIATPFDFNRGLGDEDLMGSQPEPLHLIGGTNFFRGLALIDLAEAMLKKAFGPDSIAVRVNAAGQGDFFQVHVDTQEAAVEDVKEFVRTAFYRRFGLAPGQEFVEPYPGGGAVGVRLSRFDKLPELIRLLRSHRC